MLACVGCFWFIGFYCFGKFPNDLILTSESAKIRYPNAALGFIFYGISTFLTMLLWYTPKSV